MQEANPTGVLNVEQNRLKDHRSRGAMWRRAGMSERRKLTAAERQQIYERFGGRCAYCGCKITIKDMQADHVVPLHLGGADDISNLYPACRACNHYKSTYTVEKFRAVIQRAPAVLMASSAAYRSLVRFGLIKHPDNRAVQFYFERNSEND